MGSLEIMYAFVCYRKIKMASSSKPYESNMIANAYQARECGLLILCQCSLASALKSTAEMMMGEQKNVQAVDIPSYMSYEEAVIEVKKGIEQLSQCPFIIILTDVFGATPCNIALTQAIPEHIEVLAGVNLPLLIKLIEMRSCSDIHELLDEAQDAGHRYLLSCSDYCSPTITRKSH